MLVWTLTRVLSLFDYCSLFHLILFLSMLPLMYLSMPSLLSIACSDRREAWGARALRATAAAVGPAPPAEGPRAPAP